MPDIKSAEIAVNIIRREPPPPPSDINHNIVTEVEKSLAEGKAKQAADNLKNPGKILDRPKALKEVTDAYKPNSVDNAGNLVQTPDQVDRQKDSQDLAKAYADLKKVGYDHIVGIDKNGTPLKTVLRNSVATSLFNHEAFRQIAESNGFNLTDPAFVAHCRTVAEDILRNPVTADLIMNGFVDLLATGKVDYKTLQAEIDKKKELVLKANSLKTEIGEVPSITNPAGSGIEREIFLANQKAQDYDFAIIPPVPPNPAKRVPLGPQAQVIEDAQNREANFSANRKRYTDSLSLLRTKQATGAYPFDIPDPDPSSAVGSVKAISNAGDAAAMQSQWNTEYNQMGDQSTQDKAMIKQLNDERQALKQKVLQLEQERNQKIAELKAAENGIPASDKKITEEQAKIAAAEKEFNAKLAAILPNSVLELWDEAATAVEKAKPDQRTKIEQEITDKAREMGREDLYDETKKEFRKKELHKALDDLIKNGVEGYGVSQLRNLYGQAIRVGAPPELARMAPVIEQIIDVGTGAVKDKAKLMKFASEVTGDMLKMVAIKDPKALKDRFTRDELAMKAMTGDVLPSLIENAMSDKTMKDMIEKQVGKGLASKTKTEWFKGLPWDKILKILMIVLGVTIGFGVMAAHTGGVFGGGLPGT